mgnify:CR=1 FL=1
MRQIFGSVKENNQWILRYNNELYKLFDDVCVSTVIKLKRLQWVGHVEHMAVERIITKIQYGQIRSRRPICKPRRR